jgi:NAD(P)-dependent dehydrogenase (short-subunit alcohol dehydrogenase family)
MSVMEEIVVDETKRPHVVVVTGSGALGLACARKLNSPKLKIVLADTTPERVSSACTSLGGTNVEGVVCDVSDVRSTRELADRVAQIGPMKTIVHTAGVSGTLSDVETIYSVNLQGALNVLDSFESLATTGTAGVFFASIGGHQRFTFDLDPLLVSADPLQQLRAVGAYDVTRSAAYAIAKRTVILQCQRRSRSWGSRGARLVSISPGLIEETPIGDASLSHGPGRPHAEWNSIGRNGKPDEVASVVAFLASNEASFITGCDILVDGGLLAGVDNYLGILERQRWHSCLYESPK